MAYVSGDNIPKNAVKITPVEALRAQWEIVDEWSPGEDVVALRFGGIIKCIVGCITGYNINTYYRRKCKLKNIGFFASYLPVVLLPGFFSWGYHRKEISSDILLQETKCPICLEVRSMVSQFLFCVVYPAILAPVTNYMLASRYVTCRIPMINYEPRKLWTFHKDISKQLYKRLPAWTLVNVVIAAGIAHYELKNFWTISQKLDDFEKKLRSGEITIEE